MGLYKGSAVALVLILIKTEVRISKNWRLITAAVAVPFIGKIKIKLLKRFTS